MADRPRDSASAQDFYGRWAGLYDGLCRYTPGLDSVRANAADALDLRSGDTVIDMGCGTGANLPHLRERVGSGGHIVGVDYTRGMLERARIRVQHHGWKNVEVVQADAEGPPIREGVDAVLATFVVGMLSDPAGVVEGWMDLLDSGGRIGLLDAAPRRRAGPLDAIFRGFVVASAPPTARFRYEESPAAILDQRVSTAHDAVDLYVIDQRNATLARGFVRLTAGTVA